RRNRLSRRSISRSAPCSAMAGLSDQVSRLRFGSARSGGIRVIGITLGRLAGVQRAGWPRSSGLTKSHPPAPREILLFAGAVGVLVVGVFEPLAVALECRVTAEKFPGEPGGIERTQVLIGCRRTPLGTRHKLSLLHPAHSSASGWMIRLRGAESPLARPATGVAGSARKDGQCGAPPRRRWR